MRVLSLMLRGFRGIRDGMGRDVLELDFERLAPGAALADTDWHVIQALAPSRHGRRRDRAQSGEQHRVALGHLGSMTRRLDGARPAPASIALRP